MTGGFGGEQISPSSRDNKLINVNLACNSNNINNNSNDVIVRGADGRVGGGERGKVDRSVGRRRRRHHRKLSRRARVPAIDKRGIEKWETSNQSVANTVEKIIKKTRATNVCGESCV